MTLEKSTDPKEVSQAHQIYKALAERNHPEALYRYGIAFMQSDNVSIRQDALKYIQAAAELSHPQAMYGLGSIYKNQRDYIKALKWLGKAKEVQHELASAEFEKMGSDHQIMYEVGLKYYHGEQVSKPGHGFSLGKMVINQDQGAGLHYLEIAAELGNREAMVELGAIHSALALTKDGTIEQVEKAICYYRQAISLEGEKPVAPKVFFQLARLLSSQRETLQQGDEEHEYAQKRENLAREILSFLRTAARSQYPPALTMLGRMYQEGNDFIEKDLAMARVYFEQAADLNGRHALRFLGSMYREGNGVTANLDIAAKYYMKAAGLGDKEAREPLRDISKQYKAGKDSKRFRKAHECELAATHLAELPEEKKRANTKLQHAEQYLAARALVGVAGKFINTGIVETNARHYEPAWGALNCLKEAASIFPEVHMQIAQMYQEGLRVFSSHDGLRAIQSISAAVQFGGIAPAEGYKKIAQIYRDGSGIEKNESKALKYFMRAAAETEAEVITLDFSKIDKQYDSLLDELISTVHGL